MKQESRYEPIENYGIIGDLHTVALVSKKGSIDFMSFPRFDSPTVFAALLDIDKGGCFAIHPILDNISYKQLYLPDTAVLVTRFFSDDGIAELTDYMPVDKDERNCSVIRKITTVRGTITYEMTCSPRFNYARSHHKATRTTEGVLFEEDGSDRHTELMSDIPLDIKGNDAYARFQLRERETAYFVFETSQKTKSREEPLRKFIRRTYNETVHFWQDWIDQSKYRGRWMEMVNRSAITLKLLISFKFGSVVAAATFGLPESIGGQRNWDYRYTWIRDASFTMYVLLELGFMEEAQNFLAWIERQCRKGNLQLMYSVDGKTELKEVELNYLSGYKNSKPVRIGNEAHRQFQLDVYGELLDTIYVFNDYGGVITFEFWQMIAAQVDFVVKRWKEPDHGIWEIRNDKREFLYSRLMCWVAMDRAIRIANSRSFPYPEKTWGNVRDQIFYDIYNNFWNEEVQAFVQYKGAKAIDASALMMPLRRFISPYEKRWKKTMKAIEDQLKTDVLVYRYNNSLNNIDGLEGTEGTFTMCSFWYVECLARGGKVAKAREYFEKMLGYTNHLGLFSEEIGLRGQQLGNFPQAFTHLGLISAALELDRQLSERRL